MRQVRQFVNLRSEKKEAERRAICGKPRLLGRALWLNNELELVRVHARHI